MSGDAAAWEEARGKTVRWLRDSAKEYERIADLGGQDDPALLAYLAEIKCTTYRQRAAAESALADQIAALGGAETETK